MKNQAGPASPEKDAELIAELEAAGIAAKKSSLLTKSEVSTTVYGDLHPWYFTRAWYYWVAKGPGIPLDDAELLHATHGKEVRVDGHCGCPSPREWYKGFGVGLYHVDTADGLKALADTIKTILARNAVEK